MSDDAESLLPPALLPQTLLPQTASDLAKALDQLEERLFDLPVAAITKTPAAVAPAFLDHLAWETSVDVWNAAWPEALKRDVIAGAVDLHRLKGTPYAVRTVLAAMGADSDLEEWWQEGSALERGGFAVTLYPSHNFYDPASPVMDTRVMADLREAAIGAAPVSRRLRIRHGVAPATTLHLGAVAVAGVDLRVSFRGRPMVANPCAVVLSPPLIVSEHAIALHPAATLNATTIAVS